MKKPISNRPEQVNTLQARVDTLTGHDLATMLTVSRMFGVEIIIDAASDGQLNISLTDDIPF
jgi:hypothetical protein